MITTNTGAKKIEGTDNWRQIFDAHNDSVDAHDKTQTDLDYIIKGNSSTETIAAGKFVSVRGSTISGVTDGIYKAAKAIPANTALDSTYFTPVTGGALNALSDQIENLYTYETFNAVATANTETNIEISAPNGYTKGCLIGVYGNSDWSKISIKTIACSGTDYPNRVRVVSTVAQTVYAKVLFFA